jgi:hypothetical protein
VSVLSVLRNGRDQEFLPRLGGNLLGGDLLGEDRLGGDRLGGDRLGDLLDDFLV